MSGSERRRGETGLFPDNNIEISVIYLYEQGKKKKKIKVSFFYSDLPFRRWFPTGGEALSDGVRLTFQWQNYWNSDKMKWGDIWFHCPPPLKDRLFPCVTRLQHTPSGSGGFPRSRANWISLSAGEPTFAQLKWNRGQLELQRVFNQRADIFLRLHCSPSYLWGTWTNKQTPYCTVLLSAERTTLSCLSSVTSHKMEIQGIMLTASSSFFFFLMKCCSFLMPPGPFSVNWFYFKKSFF